jgi:hypothetical protein
MKLRFGWTLKKYSSFNVTRIRPHKRDLPKSTFDLIVERNRFDIEFYEIFEYMRDTDDDEVTRLEMPFHVLSGARATVSYTAGTQNRIAFCQHKAKKLGYEEYKKKLIAEGSYQEDYGRAGKGAMAGGPPEICNHQQG